MTLSKTRTLVIFQALASSLSSGKSTQDSLLIIKDIMPSMSRWVDDGIKALNNDAGMTLARLLKPYIKQRLFLILNAYNDTPRLGIIECVKVIRQAALAKTYIKAMALNVALALGGMAMFFYTYTVHVQLYASALPSDNIWLMISNWVVAFTESPYALCSALGLLLYLLAHAANKTVFDANRTLSLLVRYDVFEAWARVLSALVKAGVGINQALLLSAETLPTMFRDEVLELSDDIANGDTYEKAFSRDRLVVNRARQRWPFQVAPAFIMGSRNTVVEGGVERSTIPDELERAADDIARMAEALWERAAFMVDLVSKIVFVVYIIMAMLGMVLAQLGTVEL